MRREKKLFQLLPVNSFSSPASTVKEPPEGTMPVPYPHGTWNRIVGLEFEIEECLWDSTVALGKHFLFERDSSLRGESAYELKTHFPRRLWEALEATDDLYAKIKYIRANYSTGTFKFSERTSTHVHVDVRDLTFSQLRALLRLYLVFERSFFEFTGRDRIDNIFCIPLSQAQVLNEPVDIQHVVCVAGGSWEKYCALNIACVGSFGSVEFRGMGGQEESDVVKIFATMCACLVEFCHQNTEEEITKLISRIKYESQYEELAKRIFGDYAKNLSYFPGHMDTAASLSKFIV